MEPTTLPDQDSEIALPTPKPTAITALDFSGTPQPIGELTGRTDYPECLRGVHVDIRGFAGVVVEIVNQSIKVRSSEGITQSFNINRLRTLFAPPERSAPAPSTPHAERPTTRPVTVAEAEPDSADEAEAEAPGRDYVENPDFTAPLTVIDELAGQPDFPQCAYGKHVDIRDFTGVVVEIVKGSLKIQSPEGITRSYNAAVLKRLYGKV